MSYTTESKSNWNPKGDKPTDEELSIGCLQRIADATENMAINWNILIKENAQLKADSDRYYSYWQNSIQENRKLYKRIAALRGWIKRYKK